VSESIPQKLNNLGVSTAVPLRELGKDLSEDSERNVKQSNALLLQSKYASDLIPFHRYFAEKRDRGCRAGGRKSDIYSHELHGIFSS
jgi:hypothetical protein